MFRFLRTLYSVFPQVLAGVFIVAVIWLFLVFPRVVNMLADLLGNMGTPLDVVQGFIHAVIAFLASLLPAYFLIWRPMRQRHFAMDGQGLIVRQGQGVGYIDTESVRQQVYTAVSRVGAVKRAEVTVENALGKAQVLVNVVTENNITGGRKKGEIRREIKKVVEDQLGVQLAGEPWINFKLAHIDSGIPYATIDAPKPAPQLPAERPVTTPAPAPRPTVNDSPVVGRRMFAPSEEPTSPTPAESEPDGPAEDKKDSTVDL